MSYSTELPRSKETWLTAYPTPVANGKPSLSPFSSSSEWKEEALASCWKGLSPFRGAQWLLELPSSRLLWGRRREGGSQYRDSAVLWRVRRNIRRPVDSCPNICTNTRSIAGGLRRTNTITRANMIARSNTITQANMIAWTNTVTRTNVGWRGLTWADTIAQGTFQCLSSRKNHVFYKLQIYKYLYITQYNAEESLSQYKETGGSYSRHHRGLEMAARLYSNIVIQFVFWINLPWTHLHLHLNYHWVLDKFTWYHQTIAVQVVLIL